MTDEIVRAPFRYHRPRTLTVAEIYDGPDPPKEMVWELCPWIRSGQNLDDNRCEQCDPVHLNEHYGPCTPCCYAMAEEACRVVLAMQRRLAL